MRLPLVLGAALRLFAALAVAWSVAVPGAAAQGVQRIAAVVNDDVISVYDIEQRVRMVMFTSGIPDSPENRRRIADQVLRALIDERLQLQEAKKRSVSVSKRDVRKGVEAIEKQNSMASGELQRALESVGIRYETFLAQLRASIAWRKLIGRRFAPRISVSDDEVAEVIARLKATRGQDEYRLSEIYLAIDSRDQEEEVRGIAERMVAQIRAGARFAALARQFSRSATAAVGGDLGWAARSEIDEDIVGAVSGMSVGEVLDPIRTVSGYRILMLAGKRKVGAASPSEIEVSLRQVFVPIDDRAGVEARAALIDRAKDAGGRVARCDDAPALAQSLGASAPQDMGTLKLTALAPAIRDAVGALGVGKASAPIQVPGGLVMLVLCDRKAPEVKLPDAAAVADQLRSRQLDLMARRYLRDLRRAAVIDVRI